MHSAQDDIVIEGLRWRRRRLLLWGGAWLVVIVGGLLSWPVLSGRSSPPLTLLHTAEQALLEARRADAEPWAPEILSDATATFERGWYEYRRQELRFVSFRNFEPARAILGTAEARAIEARLQAVERRGRARDAAGTTLAEAGDHLERLDALDHALDHASRTMRQRARMRLGEARQRFEREDYARAQHLAREARALGDGVAQRAIARASRYVDAAGVRRWRAWIEDTIDESRKSGGPAIIVYKEKNVLELYRDGKIVRSYRADMARNGVEAKNRSGDWATPEGRYRIVSKRGPRETTYYKALLLNYPNDEDLRRFEQEIRAGRISRRARPGSLIEIHGEGGRGQDWTRGCVALANSDIDDLFERVRVGTPVTIVGGDGRNGKFSNLVGTLAASVGHASQ